MATVHFRYRSLNESWTSSAKLVYGGDVFAVFRGGDIGEQIFSAERGDAVDELHRSQSGTISCRIRTQQGKTILSAFDFDRFAQSEPFYQWLLRQESAECSDTHDAAGAQCKRCQSALLDDAKFCINCGNPVAGVPVADADRNEHAGNPFAGWATLLIAGGLSCIGYFLFFFSTAVEVPTASFMGQSFGGGYVNNIGLMHDQQMGVIVGVGACVSGVVLAVAGYLRRS